MLCSTHENVVSRRINGALGGLMTRTTATYPPGPLNINGWIGLTWRHAVNYWWNPLRFFTQLADRHGDMVFFRLFGYRAYLVSDPKLVCEVLIDRRQEFVKWEHQMRVLRRVMGNSLLVQEGRSWWQHRRLIQRAFSAAALARYRRVAERVAAETVRDWEPVDTIDLESQLMNILMRVTIESFFGVRVDEGIDQLGEAIRDWSEVLQREMFEPFALPAWLPLGYKRKKKSAIAIIGQMLDRIFSDALTPALRHSDVPDLRSVLTAAMDGSESWSPQAARQSALTMMVAGVHTTAAVLSCVVRCLADHPEWQQRVQWEIDTAMTGSDPSGSTPLLDRVIKETMRLYPSAWSLFARQAAADTTIGNYRVQRGSVIFIVPYVIHRDPRRYPDPLQFDPDRFLPEEELARPKGAYLPFGLGPHVCIGATVATDQVRAVVIQLLRKFHVQLLQGRGEEPRWLVHLALRLRDGVPVRLMERSRVAMRRAA